MPSLRFAWNSSLTFLNSTFFTMLNKSFSKHSSSWQVLNFWWRFYFRHVFLEFRLKLVSGILKLNFLVPCWIKILFEASKFAASVKLKMMILFQILFQMSHTNESFYWVIMTRDWNLDLINFVNCWNNWFHQ